MPGSISRQCDTVHIRGGGGPEDSDASPVVVAVVAAASGNGRATILPATGASSIHPGHLRAFPHRKRLPCRARPARFPASALQRFPGATVRLLGGSILFARSPAGYQPAAAARESICLFLGIRPDSFLNVHHGHHPSQQAPPGSTRFPGASSGPHSGRRPNRRRRRPNAVFDL